MNTGSTERNRKEIPSISEKDYKNNYFIYFIFKYVFSFDHKIIAKQYLFTAIFWALTGGAFSMLIRLQLGFPKLSFAWLKPLLGQWIVNDKIDPEFYLSMVT